jgi:hypothetical protein
MFNHVVIKPILQVHIRLSLEFVKKEILSNVFPFLLQPTFHHVRENIVLGIDIVYVRIQNTTIPMRHVYPNISKGQFHSPTLFQYKQS